MFGKFVALLYALFLCSSIYWLLKSFRDDVKNIDHLSTSLVGLSFPEFSSQFWNEHHSLVAGNKYRGTLRTLPPWKQLVYTNLENSFGHEFSKSLYPTKTCRTPSLDVQVDNPYKSENALGKVKRSYVCLRFSKQCRGQDMEELWNRRYMKKYDTYTGTFLMTDTTALNRLKRDDADEFQKLMRDAEGEAYISAFDGGDAISGNKAKQLSTKTKYTEKFGCDYNSLKVQPAQFTMHKPNECRKFYEYISQNPDSYWIMKPILGQGGTGITLHTDNKDFDKFKQCKKDKGADNHAPNKVIIQEYIKKPLLLHGKKFDIRCYMLIASSNPYFVFYHPGYLRRAMNDYNQNSTASSVFLTNTHFQSLEENFDLGDHIWGFQRLQKYLSDNNVAGAHYVSTVLNSAIKKILLFNFQSAREELIRRKGSYHLFGLDFMIDDQLRVHFIEANGFPGFTWSKDFNTRKMVTEMFDLLLELHESPTAFERMSQGDMYGDFELIYNELEDDCSEKLYDPCVEFSNFNQDRMKDEARRIGEIHDTKRRSQYVAQKQLDHDKRDALTSCTTKGLEITSQECSAVVRRERKEKFLTMFQEIQAWDTINQFVAGM